MVASTIGLFTCPRSRPHSFKVPEVRRGRLLREIRENSRGKFDWQLAIHQVAVKVRSRKGRVHMTQTMRSIKLIGAKYAANGTRDLLPTSSCPKSLVFFFDTHANSTQLIHQTWTVCAVWSIIFGFQSTQFSNSTIFHQRKFPASVSVLGQWKFRTFSSSF